ncbi:transcription termination factor MTERF5, chloroplastic [Heracleum sosnowskyi]|uniref:Transcription termination factor MTERF5, chloroplastic n=1 Tax=Heracleum sosnowskyi TaxID=360622 RepID=A0AAD8MK35_9APIA|nr:transcription termination factor MTERF5, chloroplastic [Heracleum sosnowskyi]
MITHKFTPYFHHYSLFVLPFRTYTKNTSTTSPQIINFFTNSLGFSPPNAQSLLQRLPGGGLKDLNNPKSVINFFKSLGFSDTQIRNCVYNRPQILSSSIDKTLKPKIQLFQDLGLVDFDLGKFFSWNSELLSRNLAKTIVPCIDMLRPIMDNDKDLVVVISRSNWIFKRDPEKVLKANVGFLMECGIVGSRLSMTLKRQPWILTKNVGDLRELVGRVLEMGFSAESTMLIHAIHTINSMTSETLMRKFRLFRSVGFSEDECSFLFRKMPVLFRASEEKLRVGLLFFMNTAKFDKEVIMRNPTCLMYSMEDRVIPRYKVMEILKSKELLETPPRFVKVLSMKEDVFLDRFISSFPSEAAQLLLAYKERSSKFSEQSEVQQDALHS